MLSRFFCLFCLTGLLAGPALATGYDQTEEGKRFAQKMAAEYGFEAERISRLLADAERQPKILESISRPAEKTLEWFQYRAIFIKPERIDQGREFMAKHRDALNRAEEQFGVPAEIITAIIGVETWYGRYLGNYRVLDALATLAFDYPPRARFFRSELEQFFLMAREQGFNPRDLKGSYAGAMGYGQFISSSYRHYAVDFDGDNVADILTNPVDAIGSVANYFAKHRWKPGEPVAEKLGNLELSPGLLTRSLKPSLTIGDFLNAGIAVESSLAKDSPARALQLAGEQGNETWLTFHNFYVITRYNHSHLYAMAVFQLSEALLEPSSN